jgi:PTS system nitrogen regulatory IIA component
MKIMDFLKEKAISAHLKSKGKRPVIEELIELLVKSGEIAADAKEEIIGTLLDREKIGSTGIGEEVAIPHAKLDVVKEVVAAFGRSPQGVDFDSLDGKPAYIFFLLLAPVDSTGPHLKALARLSRILKDKPFREALKKAETEEEILKLIKEEDGKRH